MSLENNPFMADVAKIQEKQLEEKSEDLRRIRKLFAENKSSTSLDISKRIEANKNKLKENVSAIF